MVEEQPIGHEVASIQDDGGQHEQEEDVRSQRGGRLVFGRPEEQEANQNTDYNQEARFGENVVELRCHVESWKVKAGMCRHFIPRQRLFR